MMPPSKESIKLCSTSSSSSSTTTSSSANTEQFRTEYHRYFYGKERLFEKSLDVYKPILDDGDKMKDFQELKDFPIVILVVGSGWMGHRAFVYSGTSWWNSSGPKSIASTGCTCVCIRHRGALCILPPWPVIGQYLARLCMVLMGCRKHRLAVLTTLLIAVFLFLLDLAGRGSARFEDMLHDVAEALEWVQAHKDMLKVHQQNLPMRVSASPVSALHPVDGGTTPSRKRSPSSTTEEGDSSSLSSGSSHADNTPVVDPLHQGEEYQDEEYKFVFGGYSSGAHVAATLLQNPDIFKDHGLPPPEHLFRGILLISGVLAVRPVRQIDSLILNASDELDATGKGNNSNKNNPMDASFVSQRSMSNADAPRWLTDLVMHLVWGVEGSSHIPSPLANRPVNLPHLLIGCKKEMFGLRWLDLFFCSSAFCEKVKETTNQEAKFVEVNSDHWNILNSSDFKRALKEELTCFGNSPDKSVPCTKETSSEQGTGSRPISIVRD